MSSMCGNYANCLHSLSDHDNYDGLCLECHLAYQQFIANIQHSFGGHKLVTEDGIYLFLHRNCTFDDLSRHLDTNRLADYLPATWSLTKILKRLQPLQAALLCLRYRETITAEKLIELTTEPDEEEEAIDCKEDECGEDIEEPILPKICPVEAVPIEITPTEEPAPEEIPQCQTPTLEPKVVGKTVNRVPITQPDYNDRRRALRLIAKIIGSRKLPNRCVEFISIHMNGCKTAELDALLKMTTCRYLASRGVVKGYKVLPERTGRGNHYDIWMIPAEEIIRVCDKHFNWISVSKAGKKLGQEFPDVKIDRNTLRKYILEEDLCSHGEDLFGELAILASILPEVSNQYQKIRAKLVKNKGIPNKALKPNELTPKQIFLLLGEKIRYKTVLDYLVAEVILGEKRHGRWVSTTEQYGKFLQDATSGVRGIKPEHIPICREYLSKPYSIATAE